MRHIGYKFAGLTTLALGVATLTPGCADNESQFFVQGVLVPDAPPSCGVTADQGAALRLGGVMDTLFTNTYVGALLIGNQLTQRGNRDELKTETSRISIRGAEVKILTAQDQLISEFSVPATGFVDQSTGSNAAYGTASVTLVDPATGNTLAGQVTGGRTLTVVVEVRVFGDTLGGSEITSAALTYPITVCSGCLISCPADPPNSTAVCQVGIDENVDCRECVGSSNPAAAAACTAALNGVTP